MRLVYYIEFLQQPFKSWVVPASEMSELPFPIVNRMLKTNFHFFVTWILFGVLLKMSYSRSQMRN